MRFETKEYYDKKGQETFYPYADVVFEIKDSSAHYHIPLLLSPYGYTTYRGSQIINHSALELQAGVKKNDSLIRMFSITGCSTTPTEFEKAKITTFYLIILGSHIDRHELKLDKMGLGRVKGVKKILSFM